MRIKLAIPTIVVFLLACAIHRTGPTNVPVATIEQLNSDNAQIAVHNRAAAKAIVAAFQAGLLEQEYFDSISRLQIQITRAKEKLTPMLKDQPTAKSNTGKIKQLTTQISTFATDIVQLGVAGIKNPQTQAQISTEINAIATLANSIASTVQTLQ